MKQLGLVSHYLISGHPLWPSKSVLTSKLQRLELLAACVEKTREPGDKAMDHMDT